MDRDAFSGWLERYFAAWRSNDPAEVAALFAEDAVYSSGPFMEPTSGRDPIVRGWVAGGVQPGLETSFEVLAVEGERGVANWRVSFDTADGGRVMVDGILVCDFDGAGRCTLHREWFGRREVPR
ncbi:MAG TPA: nuclear transport factor 2 family protein [Actinomycetota bacterium]|nr:nuclear transport factor 2 family protein [Actinomycetota bacterium]